MRISGNKLQHIIDFFYSELEDHYDRAEIEALLAEAVAHYLGYSRTELITKAGNNLNQSDLLKLYDCAKELKKGKPLQYVLGSVPFYNTTISVNKDVLIPRPETEELTDMLVKENPEACRFLDICTGSGCIPVAIKKNLPAASVSACDISEPALRTAEQNALSNGTLVYFFKCDVLSPDTLPVKEKYDVIISNPPYVKENEKNGISPQVLDNEPHLALFVKDDDPIIFYKKIIDLCGDFLQPAGRLYFELNPLTAEDVRDYAASSGYFNNINLLCDMSGNLRFFKAFRKT
jgi:release factor glutamine methyltransferase